VGEKGERKGKRRCLTSDDWRRGGGGKEVASNCPRGGIGLRGGGKKNSPIRRALNGEPLGKRKQFFFLMGGLRGEGKCFPHQRITPRRRGKGREERSLRGGAGGGHPAFCGREEKRRPLHSPEKRKKEKKGLR